MQSSQDEGNPTAMESEQAFRKSSPSAFAKPNILDNDDQMARFADDDRSYAPASRTDSTAGEPTWLYPSGQYLAPEEGRTISVEIREIKDASQMASREVLEDFEQGFSPSNVGQELALTLNAWDLDEQEDEDTLNFQIENNGTTNDRMVPRMLQLGSDDPGVEMIADPSAASTQDLQEDNRHQGDEDSHSLRSLSKIAQRFGQLKRLAMTPDLSLIHI